MMMDMCILCLYCFWQVKYYLALLCFRHIFFLCYSRLEALEDIISINIDQCSNKARLMGTQYKSSKSYSTMAQFQDRARILQSHCSTQGLEKGTVGITSLSHSRMEGKLDKVCMP